MKYIWIVMLIVVEIIWFIFSLKDFIYTFKHYRKMDNMFLWLENFTFTYIVVHLIALFAYSFWLYIKVNM